MLNPLGVGAGHCTQAKGDGGEGKCTVEARENINLA